MISTNTTNTINSTGPNGEVVKLTLNNKKEIIKAEQVNKDNTSVVLAKDSPIFTKAIENANNNQATRRALGLTQSSQTIKTSPGYDKSNETALKNNGVSPTDSLTNTKNNTAESVKTALNLFGAGDLGGEYKPIFNETLVYPIDLAKDQDRMQITMYRYRTPFITAPTTVSAADKPRTPEEVLGSIILPMPSQLKDVSEIEWSPKTLSNLEILSGVLQGIGGVANQFKKDTGNKEVDAKTQSLLTQEETYSRFAGVISNPNQDLLFSGIGLRQFPYEFNLIPRNEAETLVIRKIVRTFRQGMLPRKLLGGAIVGAPNTFRIKFVNGRTGKPLKDVRRHKELALVNFVAYPMLTDSWMTYDDEEHSALGFKIQMVFQELTPIYYDDYTGKDINDDQIDESNGNISVGY